MHSTLQKIYRSLTFEKLQNPLHSSRENSKIILNHALMTNPYRELNFLKNGLEARIDFWLKTMNARLFDPPGGREWRFIPLYS